MEPLDLLRYLARVSDAMGLHWFVTGSTATIFYGEPRFTNDIDVVVDLAEPQVAEFCSRFPQDEFYVSEPAAREAVQRKAQFNIIHPASGLKVDVIIPEPSAFNRSRFERAIRVRPADDFEAAFASPEDAIIKKIEFYRAGGSEKHVRDIAGILKTTRESLDMAYIAHWTQQLGLSDLWTAILQRAEEDG